MLWEWAYTRELAPSIILWNYREKYENIISLLRNLVSFCCRFNGTVVDSLVGNCIPGIAMTECGGRAFVIEEDLIGFRLAESRLEMIASNISEKTLTCLSMLSVIAALCGNRIHPSTATGKKSGIGEDYENNCTDGVSLHLAEAIVTSEYDSCPSSKLVRESCK